LTVDTNNNNKQQQNNKINKMTVGGVPWQRVVGGISGAFAVGASAYGSHGLKPSKEAYGKTFDAAARFQLLHSALLVAVPAICGGSKTRAARVSGMLFTAGTLLFSGSCYAVALKEDQALGKAAPIGGFALMAGWLSLAILKK
jgi:uncharacterized membrane protein YgdD (TMEM256/DUF423 family)